MKLKKTLPGLLVLILFGVIFAFMFSNKKSEIKEKEITLKTKIEALQCNDSLLVASRDYSYLLKKDSIQLGEKLFISNEYPNNDYIWRDTKSLYEVSLRDGKIKIKRFCGKNDLAEN